MRYILQAWIPRNILININKQSITRGILLYFNHSIRILFRAIYSFEIGIEVNMGWKLYYD